MDTNAVTSSAALTELKSDLTRLSNTLHVIYDLMNTDMSQVGQAWQDGKYQEFVDGYKPQIQKCEDISARYSDWCARVLDPTIENIIAVEKTDVGGSGGSVGVGSSVGAGAGVAGAAALGAVGGKAGGFNMGGARTPTTNEESGAMIAHSVSEGRAQATASTAGNVEIGKKSSPLSSSSFVGTTDKSATTDNQSTTEKVFAQADDICKKDNRSDSFRAKLAKSEDAEFTLGSKESETGSGYSLGGKVKGGVEIPVFKVAKASVGIEGEGEYQSGRESSEITGSYSFKCVEEKPEK